MNPKDKIIGIDLGTTNSLVATVDAGLPYVIADSEGSRLTPSVIHFANAAQPPLVGKQANRVRALKPKETIYSVKRFMGRRANELTESDKNLSYPVQSSQTGMVEIPIFEQKLAPEQVSSFVLAKLKSDAEKALGHGLTRVVITVPAYFNDAQRNATKKAGELAGLTVERIINEPTAAALAYGLQSLKEKSTIAVFDLGGGTFDISILEVTNGTFQVLSTNGNTRLGGDDLDNRIVKHLINQIEETAPHLRPLEKDQVLIARVREAAEKAKCELSTKESVEISLPFLTRDFSFSHILTREKLESLTKDLIESTRANCIRALADAKLEKKDIHEVILVGGQTRMPLVKKFVQEFFGREPNTNINPDEAVALGAAIQGEILSGGFQNMLLLDVTPLSLGIETFGGLMNVLIPRNSTIPTKAGEMFTTAVNNQKSMLIHVLQGERELAKDNWSLGKFQLDFEPAPKGVPRIGVQFEIDANGILHVLARDTKSGKEKVVEVKSAVDVSDEAVEKMIEESVDHAFEDMNARKWIEARRKATDLIKATKDALTLVANKVSTEQQSEVKQAVDEIEKALFTEKPDTKSGDLSRLQKAIINLDEKTQDLAILVIEALG